MSNPNQIVQEMTRTDLTIEADRQSHTDPNPATDTTKSTKEQRPEAHNIKTTRNSDMNPPKYEGTESTTTLPHQDVTPHTETTHNHHQEDTT